MSQIRQLTAALLLQALLSLDLLIKIKLPLVTHGVEEMQML